MGSKTFDGIWFVSYSDDPLPSHVRGHHAQTVVIVDPLAEGAVQQSSRNAQS